MKNVLLSSLLLLAVAANAQTIVQPIASGNYWLVDSFAARLPLLATKTTFPVVVNFTNGYAGINSLSASRLVKQNEISWSTGTLNNAANFVVEWSRDGKTFEWASTVRIDQASNGRYVFRHRFEPDYLVYYRIGIVTGANTIAYTPAVQVADEEYSTKIYPTVVKSSTVYVQTAQTFEKLQVINSASQAVFEKGLANQTGTITVGLPPLQSGIYFVRLLAANKPQHVQRILVE